MNNPVLSSCRVIGEILNPCKKPITLMATMLFRSKDSSLVGGATFFIKDIQANELRPFDSSAWSGGIPEQYATTEISAFCGWTAHWSDLL